MIVRNVPGTQCFDVTDPDDDRNTCRYRMDTGKLLLIGGDWWRMDRDSLAAMASNAIADSRSHPCLDHSDHRGPGGRYVE